MDTSKSNRKKPIKITEPQLKGIIYESIIKIMDEDTINQTTERNRYAFDVNDEELFGFTFLSKEDTKLPYDIYVDGGECYKEYEHKMCLYVVSERNNYSLTPITISYSPIVIGANQTNYYAIMSFIKRNVLALTQYANMVISSPIFYRMLDESLNESILLEMGNYYENETGVPTTIWVDETQAYKRSNHPNSYRIKFQQDYNLKNWRLWMPVLIPTLELHINDNIPQCKVPQKVVSKVLEWAELNKEGLLKLSKAEISGKVFAEKYLKKLGEEIVVIRNHEDNVPSYMKMGEEFFNYTIVKSDEGKYNFLHSDGHLRCETWFEKVKHFTKDINGNVYAYVQLGEVWKILPLEGELRDIDY